MARPIVARPQTTVLGASRQWNSPLARPQISPSTQGLQAGALLRLRAIRTSSIAGKLTLQPADMVAEDVDPLRAQGFQDVEILHIVAVVAYYAYVNRIADGLGVLLGPKA